MITRIVVDEPDPDDPNLRVYHVDAQFSQLSRHFELPIEPNEMPIASAAGEYVRSLAIMLSSHTGVECMLAQRHSVEISKGGAYEWKDVEPLVLSAIIAVFGAFNGVKVFCCGLLEQKMKRLERKARNAKRSRKKPSASPPKGAVPDIAAGPPPKRDAQ